MPKLTAVIMAGGSGTRFWPRSRTNRPKQLLALAGERSLLQSTVDRLEGLIPADRVMIVTNAAQELETRRQLPELPPENIVVEPFGRDTAPCVGLAAAIVSRQEPEARLLVLPADHLIEPAASFRALVSEALPQVLDGRVVTFGAMPTHPATGFGYIETGEALGAGLQRVRRFKEKPDRETAEGYLDAGNFLWNCGIFLWTARTVLDELAAQEPEMHAGLLRIAAAWGDSEARSVLKREYELFRRVSIDYAVLERAREILVSRIDFSWSDLGSWTAVEELHEADAEGHRRQGIELVSLDAERCFVSGDGSEHLLALIGVKDLIVVKTADATLICHRDRVQDVKAVVAELKARRRDDLV